MSEIFCLQRREKYNENFNTVKDIDLQEEWKIRAGFVSQRYIKPGTQNGNKTQLATSTKRAERLYEPIHPQEPKRVNFAVDNKKDDTIKGTDQTDDKKVNYQKGNKGSLSAIDAINKGLRRSLRLNPEIKKGEELIALQAKLSDFPSKDEHIPGEILAMPVED